MLNQNSLSALQQFRQANFSNIVPERCANLGRGAIYWVNFDLFKDLPHAPHKSRPAIVMTPRAKDQLGKTHQMYVVPISQQMENTFGTGVPITIDGAQRRAVVSQAMTIDETALMGFAGNLSSNDLAAVTLALGAHMNNEAPRSLRSLKPGNRFAIERGDGTKQPVVILNAGHVLDPSAPIQALTFDNASNLDQPSTRLVSIGREYFYHAERLGVLDSDIFEQARSQISSAFGLKADVAKNNKDALIQPARHHLERKAVYWYEFHEPVVIGSELYKRRPIILMDNNPASRLMQCFHVVPASSQIDNPMDIRLNMGCDIPGKALTTHATTVNSERLAPSDFITMLSDEEMNKICSRMAEEFLRKSSGARDKFDAGGVVKIAWKGNETRNVLILNDAYSAADDRPVLVAPVPDLSAAESGDFEMKPRPVDPKRLDSRNTKVIGKISLGALKRRQKEVRQIYGF